MSRLIWNISNRVLGLLMNSGTVAFFLVVSARTDRRNGVFRSETFTLKAKINAANWKDVNLPLPLASICHIYHYLSYPITPHHTTSHHTILYHYLSWTFNNQASVPWHIRVKNWHFEMQQLLRTRLELFNNQPDILLPFKSISNVNLLPLTTIVVKVPVHQPAYFLLKVLSYNADAVSRTIFC